MTEIDVAERMHQSPEHPTQGKDKGNVDYCKLGVWENP